jgi:uncharacterized protein YjcR
VKPIKEIAKMFGVSGVSVRNWLIDGLPYKKEKVIGRRTRIVIDPADVYAYHKAKENIVKKGE